MLCPSCGVSVGDAVRLCDQCAEAKRPVPGVAQQPVTGPPPPTLPRRPHSLEDTLRQRKVYLPICGALFVILFLLTLLLHPTKSIWLSFLAAIIVSLAVVSICAWGQMWIHLFIEHAMLAFLSLVLPVGVYRMVIAYPETMMKPFLIHMVTAILSTVLSFYYYSVAHASAWSVLFGADKPETEYYSDY